MAVSRPVAAWGRLEVEGLDALPASWPVLVVANHDCHWDPSPSAWRHPPAPDQGAGEIDALGRARPEPGPDGMGQIPIERGAGSRGALAGDRGAARGACIGVFPEGTRSRGKVLRARSGVGRLALEVPEAKLVCVAIEGTADITGFPRRPRLRTRFFEPAGGQARPGEEPGEIASRLLAEIRDVFPRRSRSGSAPWRRAAA